MQSRQKRLERAQMRVLFTVPFFAPAVARLPVEFVDPSVCPTACTDGKRIQWNREWFDKLPDPVLPTVLCHEACHCLLGHLWRHPPNPNWKKWNIATDHLVNLMLKEVGSVQTNKGLADPFPFPEPASAFYANPAYKDWAEEQVYYRMPDPPDGDQQKPGQGAGQGGQGSGQGTQPGQEPGEGSMPSFGDMEDPKDHSGGKGTSEKKLEESWKQTAINSAHAAGKGRGTVPAGFERFVERLTSNQIPWYDYVRGWLSEKATDDWNFMVPNPCFDGSGFLMPSLENDALGEIVMGKDSSGSIDMEVYAKFVAEEQSFLDNCRPSKITDIICDSRVQKVTTYVPGQLIDTDAPGGGGTSFVPVFEYIEENGITPKCVVILTDMDGTFPDNPPNCPVLWVNYGRKGQKAPFGEVVDVE